jgi:hypothetical protein
MNGQLVKTIRDIYQTEGYTVINRQSGTEHADGGDKLQGMYVYRLILINANGSAIQETNKLVIIK